jgi:hypothetical protein
MKAGDPSAWVARRVARKREIELESQKKGQKQAGDPRPKERNIGEKNKSGESGTKEPAKKPQKAQQAQQRENEIDRQFSNLFDLVLIIYGHYPKVKTRNPYQRITDRLFKASPPSDRQLFTKVLHSLTSLYHLVRHRNTRGEYESSREDLLASLHLLKDQLDPRNVLSKDERLFFRSLERQFRGVMFSREQVQVHFLISNSHVKRQLHKFYMAGLLERSGNANRGYRYAVIEVVSLERVNVLKS